MRGSHSKAFARGKHQARQEFWNSWVPPWESIFEVGHDSEELQLEYKNMTHLNLYLTFISLHTTFFDPMLLLEDRKKNMEDIREDLKKRSHPHFHGKVPELQAKIKLKGEKALWIEQKNLIEFYYWTCEISSHFPKQWDDYYIILLNETIIITKSDSKHKNVSYYMD